MFNPHILFSKIDPKPTIFEIITDICTDNNLLKMIMTFEETTQFLYNQIPVFQHSGASAYKPGLDNTTLLDKHFGHPHKKYKTIHIGGTNGKGSTSHTLAAILQKSNYKVGLYTSPHLIDFRERIRVDGVMASQEFVVDFVAKNMEIIQKIRPSFFELTMMMAFCYFEKEEVDVAIIEVGLGGRLDSTNIITPTLSVITNISLDHVQFLGDTLEKIAFEKAGIIKKGVPIVIGEAEGNLKVLFKGVAHEVDAPICFAQELDLIRSSQHLDNGKWCYQTAQFPDLIGELGGDCQKNNSATILASIEQLRHRGFAIPDSAVYGGFAQVVELTGLQGRWQKLSDAPLTICDTGHNTAGIKYIVKQLQRNNYKTLRIVLGVVNDKDIRGILSLLPQDAIYYFTKASILRAMPEMELKQIASEFKLVGSAFPTVKEAYDCALSESDERDLIFIGGSTFVIADLLSK